MGRPKKKTGLSNSSLGRSKKEIPASEIVEPDEDWEEPEEDDFEEVSETKPEKGKPSKEKTPKPKKGAGAHGAKDKSLNKIPGKQRKFLTAKG